MRSGLRSRTWRRTSCRTGALRRVGAAAALVCSGRLCPTDGFAAKEGPLGTPRGALRGPSQHLPLGSGPAASSAAARLLRGRLTEGAGPGNAGHSPRSGREKPSRSGGRPGVLGLPGVPGVLPVTPGPERADSAPPTALQGPPPPHEAPDSQERRASEAVLPSPFPTATATKWRTREKRPATSPLRSARSICARAGSGSQLPPGPSP